MSRVACVRLLAVLSFPFSAAFGSPVPIPDADAGFAAPQEASTGPHCELRCNGEMLGRWRFPSGKVFTVLPVFTRKFDRFAVPEAHASTEEAMRIWMKENGDDLCMRNYCPAGSYQPGSGAHTCPLSNQGSSEIPVRGVFIAVPESGIHALRCVPGN